MKYNFNIAEINQCTESEGPFKRLAIWFQGCNIQCKECCNPKLFALKQANLVSFDELVEIVIEAKNNFGIEGVTYLGGEPTLQQGLSKLSLRLKQLDIGILLFTGKLMQDLPKELIESVDLVIDGQFEKDNLDKERNLIGSKNQRLIFVTDRYVNSLNWFSTSRSKIVEINVSENFIITGDVILKNNHPISKHFAKAPHANSLTKALSKSSQSQRTVSNCFKNLSSLKKIKNADTQADRKERK